MKKLKVLVLGHQGMLGRELMQAFSHCQITGWDIDDLNIADQVDVQVMIALESPGIIINAAAYTSVDDCEDYKGLCMRVNGDAVGYIAEAAKLVGATVVHFSSDYVFSGEAEAGYDEDDVETKPINTYGQSKAWGEKLLRKSAGKYYLIRTQWLYGAGGKNFVDTMLRLAEGRRQISVVNDQYGSPTWVRDLALATKILVNDYKPGVYHLVNEGIASWYELAEEIFSLRDFLVDLKAVSSQDFPRPAKRPQFSCLLNTRGPKMRRWQKALEEYLLNRD